MEQGLRDVWYEEYGDVWSWEDIAAYAREARSSWTESYSASETGTETQSESESSSSESETDSSSSDSEHSSSESMRKETDHLGRTLSVLKGSHRNLRQTRRMQNVDEI
jgi:hypothetical protein